MGKTVVVPGDINDGTIYQLYIYIYTYIHIYIDIHIYFKWSFGRLCKNNSRPGKSVPDDNCCVLSTYWRLNKMATILQMTFYITLQWRHNDHDGVSNHQPHGCLLNRLFKRRSKKTSKLRVTGLYVGNSPGPVNSPHKGPVTRKMFPFDDVIMDRTFLNVKYCISMLISKFR